MKAHHDEIMVLFPVIALNSCEQGSFPKHGKDSVTSCQWEPGGLGFPIHDARFHCALHEFPAEPQILWHCGKSKGKLP
jgi:hypothetical protein